MDGWMDMDMDMEGWKDGRMIKCINSQLIATILVSSFTFFVVEDMITGLD